MYYRSLLCYIIWMSVFISCKDKNSINHQDLNSTIVYQQIEALYVAADKFQYSQADSALALYMRVKKVSRENHWDSLCIESIRNIVLLSNIHLHNSTQAKKYADTAWQIATSSSGNERLIGQAHYTYGTYYASIDDFDPAVEHLLEALKPLDKIADSTSQKKIYSYLAYLHYSQNNYENALAYYQPQINSALQSRNSSQDIITILNAYCYSHPIEGKQSLTRYYLFTAKDIAQKIRDTTFATILYSNLAAYYGSKKMNDSSIYYARLAIANIEKSPKGYERAEIPYTTLVGQYLESNQYANAELALKKILKQRPVETMDTIGQIDFYNYIFQIEKHKGNISTALAAHEKMHAYSQTVEALAKKKQLLDYDKQVKKLKAQKTITQKNMEIRQQKLFNHLLLAGILLLTLLIIYTYFAVQRRKKIAQIKLLHIKQEKELQREKELLKIQIEERNRISQEMHDDLGSTLTTVHMGLELLQKEPTNAQYLSIINKATNTLSNQINEAIWNLNVRNDFLFSLIGFFSRYAKEFLCNSTIQLHLNHENVLSDYVISGIIRRGLYLTLKELLNNIVKFAQAKNIYIDFAFDGALLTIKIKDDGVGISFDKLGSELGNGLINMKHTITQLNGTISWKVDEGTTVYIQLPIN